MSVNSGQGEKGRPARIHPPSWAVGGSFHTLLFLKEEGMVYWTNSADF